MKKIALALCAALTFSSFAGFDVKAVTVKNIYVSPNGADSNDGSLNAPLKTLEGARDYIRRLKDKSGMPEGGIKVILREGDYVLDKTFELDSRDSGTKASPVEYIAYPGEEARILGGVKADKFKKVTDSEMLSRLKEEVRDKAYETSFSDYGITNVSELECFGQSAPALDYSSVQVFKNGEFMDLSRYPNDGFLTVDSVINEGAFNKEFKTDMANAAHVKPEFGFKYDGVKNWKDTDDIWIFGYLRYDWADLFAKVDKLDKNAGTLKLLHASPYTITSGRKFYFANVFEELDSEKEYFIDRKGNKLYVICDDIENTEYEVAVMDDDLVRLENASNITFSGLTFSLCRAIDIHAIDSENINVTDCEISKNGKDAIFYDNCYEGEIKDNHIYIMGAKGINVDSGDIDELIYSNIKITNNNIHDFGLVEKTYRAGIQIEGVGNYIAHNEIYNATHYGVSYGGHFNVFEYNDVHHCLMMAEDAGSVYTGRTWLCSGNTFRYNFFHDIPMNTGGSWKNNAVYLDDGMLGTDIHSNVFKDVQVGVFLHGGRYTKIRNNVFINCMESVSIVNIYNPAYIVDTMFPNTKDKIERNPMWATYFPEAVSSVNDNEPTKPKNNEVTGNVMFNTPEPTLSEDALKYGTVENNISVGDKKIFEDFDNENFTIKKESAIYKLIPEFDGFDFNLVGNIK